MRTFEFDDDTSYLIKKIEISDSFINIYDRGNHEKHRSKSRLSMATIHENANALGFTYREDHRDGSLRFFHPAKDPSPNENHCHLSYRSVITPRQIANLLDFLSELNNGKYLAGALKADILDYLNAQASQEKVSTAAQETDVLDEPGNIVLSIG